MARRANRNNGKPAEPQAWEAWLLGSSEGLEGYLAESRSLALSFVLITPLLFAYEVALFCYAPAQPRGAGRFFRELLTGVFHTKAGVALNLLVLAALILAIYVLARRGRIRINLIVPVLLESAAWALALVGLAALVVRRLQSMPMNVGGTAGAYLVDIVGSIGAGVYEEILFRLLLTSALFLAGLYLFQERRGRAALFAIVGGSLVFAAAHVLAPGAVPLTQTPGLVYFAFYLMSGVFFSVLYMYRGLGVAAYTHVLYDVIAVLAG